jgi:ABC-type multidrug transport system fused ATPase/permease subunit
MLGLLVFILDGFVMEFLHLFKVYWKTSRPEQWRVVFYVFWHAFSVVGSLCQPYAFAMALNCLQNNRIYEIWKWLILYAVGFTVFEVGHRIARSTERYLAFRNRKRYVLASYERLQSFPLKWHNDHHSANTIDRVNKAADALFHYGQCQSNYIEVIVNLIGSLLILWTISPLVSIIGCVIGFLSVIITKGLYRRSVPEYRMQNELFHKLAAALMDYVSNITTIIVLRLGLQARDDLSNRIDNIFPHLVKEHRITQVKCFISAFLVAALNISMIVYYIHTQASSGQMIMVGAVATLFQYLNLLMTAFGFYGGDYENVIHWWQDYNAASLLYNDDNESMEIVLSQETAIPRNWLKLLIHPLSFSYGVGQAELKCNEIVLERGKRIAFVGESGAGKSTCLHILRGLLTTNGLITVDEKLTLSIREIGQIATLIGQEPEIFENTIRYNITLGLPASEGEIIRSAKIACFDEVADKLPSGYDSDIRENGVNLSGGEKQRLSLTRGIFAIQDSSLVLLDEPTSSLDTATEMTIYKRMFETLTDHCVVSTIHRLHLLPLFDYVYVFRDGKIVESGTFQSLLRSSGELSRLWSQYGIKSEIEIA